MDLSQRAHTYRQTLRARTLPASAYKCISKVYRSHKKDARTSFAAYRKLDISPFLSAAASSARRVCAIFTSLHSLFFFLLFICYKRKKKKKKTRPFHFPSMWWTTNLLFIISTEKEFFFTYIYFACHSLSPARGNFVIESLMHIFFHRDEHFYFYLFFLN